MRIKLDIPFTKETSLAININNDKTTTGEIIIDNLTIHTAVQTKSKTIIKVICTTHLVIKVLAHTTQTAIETPVAIATTAIKMTINITIYAKIKTAGPVH